MSALLKRGIDILAATVLLILLCPLMLIIAAAVLICEGKPVLFRQTRAGYRGWSFELLKFRTMTSLSDSAGNLLPDSERTTRFGHLLRATSLDELPQLWNVLRGEMSLVGPRPLLPQYLARYTPQQARRHEVRPGITGWAQVNGRNATSWEERFSHDLWYVDYQSLALDLKILFLTLAHLLSGRGVNTAEGSPMPEFFPSEVAAAGELKFSEK